MNRNVILSILIILGIGKIQAQNSSSALNLNAIFVEGKFGAKYPPSVQIIENTDFYAEVAKTESQKPAILKKSFSKKNFKDTLFSGNTYPLIKSIDGYNLSKMGNLILIQTESKYVYRHSAKAVYYVINQKDKSIKAIADGKKVFFATLSPNEQFVGYISENNLFVEDLNTGNKTQITRDGKLNSIINGKSDWVYEEEFVLVKAFEFSPDGHFIGFLKFDESKVKEINLPIYDSLYPTQYTYKYPKVGESNSIVTPYIYDVYNSILCRVNSNSEKGDIYIPKIQWKDNQSFLYYQMNRLQNELQINQVETENLTQGKVLTYTTVFKEESKDYLDLPSNITYLKNGTSILTSEIGGNNQICQFSPLGMLIRKISPDKMDVDQILKVDEKNRTIYFSGYTADKSSQKRVYKVSLSGADFQDLGLYTEGSNSLILSGDAKYGILTESRDNVPPQSSIIKIGKKVKAEYIVEDNKTLHEKIDSLKFQSKKFEEIKINGALLNTWMIKPSNFEANRKYPVLICIYGGPGSQQVKDEYGGGTVAWYQYLANKGYIIYCVDGRGTGGKGTEFKKCTYKKLGLLESDDIIETARMLGQKSFVDKDRIGIFGWSFGGSMSLMSVLRGNDVFKMAVSVAPVTDWRYYDNIYTERYMQRDVENHDGYENTSVLKYADLLRDNQKLLLIHGTFDDNVHPQNSFMLVDKFIKLNKKFDSEFYPNRAHGLGGNNGRPHVYQRITDFILSNL